MERPTAAQFQLTDRAIASLNRFGENTSIRIWVFLLGAAALVGFVLGARDGDGILSGAFLGTIFALQSAAGAFMPAMALALSWEFVASIFSPAVRRYRKYKRAERAYAEWERRTKVAFWLSLTGLSFEAELARLFQRAGYQVQLTPPSGDKGVDIILTLAGTTIIVQCKATAKPVGPAVARELYGTLVSSGAHEAILAVTGGLSRGARDFIRGKPIHIMTLTDIMALQSDPASYSERLRLTRALEWRHSA